MKKITVNIRRHSISDKTTGEKDYPISEEGRHLAFSRGMEIVIPEGGGFHVYSSPKRRAIETAKAVALGALNAVIKRKVEEPKENPNYANYNLDLFIKELGLGNVSPELDSMAGYIRIPDIKKVFCSMPLDDAVNLVLNEDPEAAARAGREIQEFVSYTAVKSSKDNTLVEGITHGPKVEAGLVSFFRAPIKDIREIGGAANECDYFSLELTGQNGVFRLEKIIYKGQEFKPK